MLGGVARRPAGHVVRPAVGLAAVPEHLEERDQQAPRAAVRVGRLEDDVVGVEVHRARQEGAVVHRGHAEHRAPPVRRDRGGQPAEDGALRVRVEVQLRGVEQLRPAGALERGVRGEALRVREQPAQVERVDDPLLEAIRQRRELRDVLEDLDRVRDVVARHARPVGRAEREVVLRAHVLDVDLLDLRVGAEQAVAVEGDARRRAEGHARDVALERRLRHVALHLRGQRVRLPARVVEARAGRAALAVQVAGDRDRAGDPARDQRVLRGA